MSQRGGTGLMYRSYRCVQYGVLFYRTLTFRSVQYRYPCCTDTDTNSGKDVYTGIRGVHTGTSIDVVPNLPKGSVPVLMYRTYRSVRHRYWCCTELTEVSGTGIDVAPNLPVPVLMLYRTYPSVRYRYWCCTEHTEVSGTGIDVVPNLPKFPVPVIPAVRPGMYRTEHTLANYQIRKDETHLFLPKNLFLPNLRSNRQLEPHLPLIDSCTIFRYCALW